MMHNRGRIGAAWILVGAIAAAIGFASFGVVTWDVAVAAGIPTLAITLELFGLLGQPTVRGAIRTPKVIYGDVFATSHRFRAEILNDDTRAWTLRAVTLRTIDNVLVAQWDGGEVLPPEKNSSVSGDLYLARLQGRDHPDAGPTSIRSTHLQPHQFTGAMRDATFFMETPGHMGETVVRAVTVDTRLLHAKDHELLQDGPALSGVLDTAHQLPSSGDVPIPAAVIDGLVVDVTPRSPSEVVQGWRKWFKDRKANALDRATEPNALGRALRSTPSDGNEEQSSKSDR